MNKKSFGNLGEELVKKYLIEMNYKIIQTNFICKQGEIDIIAQCKKELIFIEVKTRANRNFGYGIESVDRNKQKHIKQATKYFIYKNNLENTCIRFDIIEVYLYKKRYYINHIKNVMW